MEESMQYALAVKPSGSTGEFMIREVDVKLVRPYQFLHVCEDYWECWRYANLYSIHAESAVSQARMILEFAADPTLGSIHLPLQWIHDYLPQQGMKEIWTLITYYMDSDIKEMKPLRFPVITKRGEKINFEDSEKKFRNILSMNGSIKVKEIKL